MPCGGEGGVVTSVSDMSSYFPDDEGEDIRDLKIINQDL